MSAYNTPSAIEANKWYNNGCSWFMIILKMIIMIRYQWVEKTKCRTDGLQINHGWWWGDDSAYWIIPNGNWHLNITSSFSPFHLSYSLCIHFICSFPLCVCVFAHHIPLLGHLDCYLIMGTLSGPGYYITPTFSLYSLDWSIDWLARKGKLNMLGVKGRGGPHVHRETQCVLVYEFLKCCNNKWIRSFGSKSVSSLNILSIISPFAFKKRKSNLFSNVYAIFSARMICNKDLLQVATFKKLSFP